MCYLVYTDNKSETQSTYYTVMYSVDSLDAALRYQDQLFTDNLLVRCPDNW